MTLNNSWPVEVRLALESADLTRQTVSYATPSRRQRFVGAMRHRVLTGDGLPPIDVAKQWDEANVAELLFDAPRSLSILDCGACNSPVPPTLASMGFSDVHGIDVDPHVTASLFGRSVRYSVQDMQATAYADESFDIVTTGSTIEHGVDWPTFLAEAARVLKPGGMLYVSTDLVPDGTDTSDASAFGFPWNPLRPSLLEATCDLFATAGFATPKIPSFELPIVLPKVLPVTFLGQQLAFIAFVTVKK